MRTQKFTLVFASLFDLTIIKIMRSGCQSIIKKGGGRKWAAKASAGIQI